MIGILNEGGEVLFMGIFVKLGWFIRKEKYSYMLGIFALLLIGLVHLVTPYAVRVVVDHIANGTLTSQILFFWVAICMGLAIVQYCLGFLWRIGLYGASNRLGKLLRNRLYEHFTKMSPRFFHQRRTGDLMAHATNDIQAVVVTAGDGVLTLVDSIIYGGLVIGAMILFIDWKLTIISLLPLPLMAYATSKYGFMLHARFHKAQEAFSKTNDKVQENITGVRVIKAFGQEEAEKKEFRKLLDHVVEKNIAVARVDALFDPTIMLVVGFSYLLMILYGSYSVDQGWITIGELVQFSIYLGQLTWPLLAFGWLTNLVERGRASYERIESLLQVESDVKDDPKALDQKPTGTIEFAVESFTYPGTKEPALRDIHLQLKPGETLGIVGKTGSGKTTLIRLLLREFDVENGVITFGGRPLNEYRLTKLSEAFGYVPQDHFLFSATIKENIAFGKTNATMEEIEQVTRLADVHNDILQFEKGYDTIVGERGVTLSGGQKQRISIARALLLDPDILILDDALSAVDGKTEHQILQNLKEIRREKTMIIASHRLSAVEEADQIIVLDEGKIIEKGTHEELMNQKGWYFAMYERQQLEKLVQEGGRAEWS